MNKRRSYSPYVYICDLRCLCDLELGRRCSLFLAQKDIESLVSIYSYDFYWSCKKHTSHKTTANFYGLLYPANHYYSGLRRHYSELVSLSGIYCPGIGMHHVTAPHYVPISLASRRLLSATYCPSFASSEIWMSCTDTRSQPR